MSKFDKSVSFRVTEETYRELVELAHEKSDPSNLETVTVGELVREVVHEYLERERE